MKKSKQNDVEYIVTKNNKFKTTRVSVKFALPISNDIIADALVLNDLMVMSTNRLNTIKEFNEKLYELYDLSVSSSVSQKGMLHISEINFSFINSSFLSDDIDMDIVEFIKDVIFNPNLTNDKYIKNVIERRILEVKTTYDDKMMYCLKSMQEKLDSESKYIIDVNSTEEDLLKVNEKTLVRFYENMMSSSSISIFIDGGNSEEIKDKLSDGLKFSCNKNDYQYLSSFEEKSSFKFFSETQDLNQSKFAIGVKLDLDRGYFTAFQIFNAIYGGFPFSRLFSNIREKQSLAYTVGSVYSPASNIMYIYGGIGNGEASLSDADHFETILSALNTELDSMRNGDITDLEMMQAKSMIINSVKSSLDSQASTQALNYSKYLLDEEFDFVEFEEKVNSIRKEDVVEMAKQVSFDTVFLLRGNK